MGISPTASRSIFRASTSTHSTWLPASARQAPVTRPTYPEPKMVTRILSEVSDGESRAAYLKEGGGSSWQPAVCASASWRQPASLVAALDRRFATFSQAPFGGEVRHFVIVRARDQGLLRPDGVPQILGLAILSHGLGQQPHRTAAIEARERDQKLVEQLLHALPGNRVLHCPQDHGVIRAGDIAADQQFLEEFLRRAQAGVLNFDVAFEIGPIANREAHEVDHAARKIVDAHGTAHIKDEYIAA